MDWVIIALKIALAISAGVSAYYWWRSAQIKTPKGFTIYVVEPIAISPELKELCEKLVEQANLNKLAAAYAAASAVVGAVIMAAEIRTTVLGLLR